MPDTLAEAASRLQAACLARGVTVATAESCTGGLVSDAITDVPGSSGYFRGGVVAYSDEVKHRLLDVPEELLQRCGAVSAEVAVAMAEGARFRLGADLGLGVTGVAGPGGGSAAKPVGLVYVAVADGRAPVVERFAWRHDRVGNKLASAQAALRMLLGAAGGRP